jgi:hypothetical protein
MTKKFLLFVLLFFSFERGNSQVLISLILGDNLNSGKVEFGLDGGLSISSQTNTTGSKTLNNFQLGFYFDINIKEPWMIHTGVIVKSRFGSSSLPVYYLGQADLDTSFIGGNIDRKLDYFNVPVMIKYKLKNHFYLETGPLLGLLYGATDEFNNTVQDHELTYRVKNRKNYHPLDAGWMTGIGYRLFKGNGMNLSARYYFGFVDITIDDKGGAVKNNSLYFSIGIPIGAGKAKEREKKKLEEQNNKQ